MSALTLLTFMAGLVLLLVGAELLVRGAARGATAFGISPLVVGLTVVAFGTSSAELAVSLQAALAGSADIAFGNVVGSNICNVLLILGLAATLTPLVVDRRLVRIDAPVFLILSLVMGGMALDGVISRLDGVILVAVLAGYMLYSVRESRRESAVASEGIDAASARTPRAMVINLALFVGGLALLVLGSRLLVQAAEEIARAFGLSELVIGLTVVSLGTSLPEVATSVLAAYRGQKDIAVGNAVGSNIWNILCVLGLTSVIAPGGVAAAPSAMAFDVPVMIAASFACLPIFFTGYRIDRWEGFLLLGYYVAYLGFVILDAQKHDTLPLLNSVMIMFIMPLTVITLGVTTIRSFRSAARRRTSTSSGDDSGRASGPSTDG